MCPYQRKTVEQPQKYLWIALHFSVAYGNVARHAKSNTYEQ